MKFSENWLRELVDIPVGRDELAHRLTMVGLEVESVTALGAHLDDVIVAQIVEAKPHPEADRLQVCSVAIGRGEPLQIVCGAPNARVGLKAPLALVGATIPGGITIQAAQLRGMESTGMLCSAKELGLDPDASGLFELPADAPVGTALTEFLGLPDAVIELGLTPNRADCLGMRGLALDMSAAFASELRTVPAAAVGATLDDVVAIRLDAPQDCPRYCGRVLRGLDIAAPSPLWLAERLRRAGVRPISAIVDVTNYVMLETGQPLHAFDASAIAGGIVVRRAGAGEKLTLLDGHEVVLDPGFLVIADERRALALAGLMGGYDSRVTDATGDIFLESAHFAPSSISGRARKLGLQTDAAHRFERGVDPELPRSAIERATELLLQIAGGQAGPVVEAVAKDHLPQRAWIRLRKQRLQRVLGINIPDREVPRILLGLGMQVVVDNDGWQVMPPSARFDMAIEEDLIEEVARIYGYDALPAQSPRGEILVVPEPEDRVPTRLLREQLAARGYHEAVNYAFVGTDLLARWELGEGGIALANPLSADLAVMRTSLLPGLVQALQANRNRQQSRVRLFELGRSYHAGLAAPVETDRIAGVVLGPAVAEQWGENARASDFFDVKGDVQSLLALTGASRGTFQFVAGGPDWLHPGRCASVLRDGVAIGWLGALNPRLQKTLDLDEDVYVFELEVAAVAQRKVPVARELSRFPSVRRDIALTLPETVSCAQVEQAIRGALGPILVELSVFDRYVGGNLGTAVKSLAIGLILQDHSRTLTDQDADRAVALAVAALEAQCAAKLRG